MNVTEETPAATPMVDTATVRGYITKQNDFHVFHCFHCRDPAARRTGLFLFITLTAVTIGAALGIGLGNISHSRE